MLTRVFLNFQRQIAVAAILTLCTIYVADAGGKISQCAMLKMGDELDTSCEQESIQLQTRSLHSQDLISEDKAFDIVKKLPKDIFHLLLLKFSSHETLNMIFSGRELFTSTEDDRAVAKLLVLLMNKGFAFDRRSIVNSIAQTEDGPISSIMRVSYSSPGLRFFSIGDWGEVNRHSIDLANSMAHQQGAFEANFVVSVGDNFYEIGVLSVDDDQWDCTFDFLFLRRNKGSLRIPWYPVLGNHDSLVSSKAQIKQSYTGKYPMWRFPSEWYAVVHTYPNAGNLEKETTWFLHINTWLLLNGWPFERNRPLLLEQLLWLDTMLKMAVQGDAKWIFIVGHHTVQSSGIHGALKLMAYFLKPFLEKYKVDVYFAGHDHQMEILSDSFTDYYVTGGFCKSFPTGQNDKMDKHSIFFTSNYGYMSHVCNGDELFTTIHGEKFDLFNHTKRSNQALRRAGITTSTPEPILLWVDSGGKDPFPYKYDVADYDIYMDYRHVVEERLDSVIYDDHTFLDKIDSGKSKISGPIFVLAFLFLFLI